MNEATTNLCPVPAHWSLNLFIKEVAYIPAALLGLSLETYSILAVFMAIDFILGLLRAVVLHGARSVKSYKIVSGVISKILVLCTPLLLVWAGEGAGIPLLFLAQWAVGVLVLAQAYSILGHINAIRTGEDKTEWDAVAWAMGNFRGALENLLTDSHSKERK